MHIYVFVSMCMCVFNRKYNLLCLYKVICIYVIKTLSASVGYPSVVFFSGEGYYFLLSAFLSCLWFLLLL